MNSFFNMDNPVMRLLTKLFDVMYLSIVWFVFSIPLITIGASTTAMYYVTVKVIRRDRGYVFKEFWKSFKMNFLQATLAWIMVAAGTVLFYFNIKFALSVKGNAGTLLTIAYAFMGLLVIGCGMYLFPVLSRFSMKFGQLIKTSILLFFKHFVKSIILALILAGALAFLYVCQLGVFFIPVCGTLLFSFVMEPTLKLYTPHVEDEEQKKDEWYLE